MATTDHVFPDDFLGETTSPEPSDILSIIVDQDDDTAVLTVRGEIDLYTAPLLCSALRSAIAGTRRLVVVDLAEVTFLASSGLAALLAGLDAAERRRCRLRLAGGGRAVLRPLEAAGLIGCFEHFPSAADAIRPTSAAPSERARPD